MEIKNIKQKKSVRCLIIVNLMNDEHDSYFFIIYVNKKCNFSSIVWPTSRNRHEVSCRCLRKLDFRIFSHLDKNKV